MSSKPFIIYKSSAGSGKTYTLTMEYLKLALRSPEAFQQILAVTFTNKATQEMKERILKELKRLRVTVDPSQKMDGELLTTLKITQTELMARAAMTLTAILHQYNRFSVSTIDSFFQKVVRSFAREMDLNAKFEVELDQDAVLDRVVDRVIMQVMHDKDLHKWLVDYADEQIQQGKSWDIRRNIKGLGMQIFGEEFKKYSNEIREFLKDGEQVQVFRDFVKSERQRLIQIARDLKNKADIIRQDNSLEWTDFKGGVNGVGPKFGKLGQSTMPFPELTVLQNQNCNNEEEWFAKSSTKKDAICNAFHQGLSRILAQFQPLKLEWDTLQAISKNIYVYGVFRFLLEELSALKDEENILLISDANEFLKEITKENEAPFVYEKVGNQYRNYLIDEFQDTSGFQWASFKPLLENSLAQGNTNLLVGDVKQSIYRWRGGEMKLLLDQVEAEIGTELVENRNLDTNFRSLPNVINFNNVLFGHLPGLFEEALRNSCGATDSNIISQAYAEVAQQVSARKSGLPFRGKVKVEFFEKEQLQEDEDGESLNAQAYVIAKLPQMVMDLQDMGYEPRDIAFLVRRKVEGEWIADALMACAQEVDLGKYCFDVLSDESMFLYKAASVKALVAALGYLHDPEDKVKFKTIWYYKALLFGQEVDHELFTMTEMPEELKAKAESFKLKEKHLLQLPLLELLEELMQELEFHLLASEKAYTSGFKEAIYDYTSKNRADLAGFLEWWEENHQKRTVKIPDGHNAMRILTIHKSKGLQFKVVVMPFLSWKIFDTSKGNVLWVPFELKEKQLEAILPLSLSKLYQTHFKSIYEEEAILAHLDSLNMLYVALTRAEEVLWAISPYKSGKPNDIESHLLTALLKMGTQEGWGIFDQDKLCYEIGDWPEQIKDTVPVEDIKPMRWSYRQWKSLLSIRSYANDFSAEGLAQRKKRDFGVLVHELLEQSKSKAEIHSNLEKMRFEGRLDAQERIEVGQQLNRLFANPLFASWFQAKEVILAEQGILLPKGGQRRPDRILLGEDKAVIVDFKTGEMSERYFNQVREYMDLVNKLTGKKVSGYLCYLESGIIEEVYA